MVEAQFYPDDFNGIVCAHPPSAGRPSDAKFIKSCQLIYPNPKDLKPVISNDNLKLLQEQVLASM
jgi:hypothetical protein